MVHWMTWKQLRWPLALFYSIDIRLTRVFFHWQSVDERFEWSQQLQGVILSAFYVGYVIFHLPGGILAERIGGKPVIAGGLFLSAIMSALTPVIVNSGGPSALITLRAILGVVQAGFFPAVSTMLSKWVPTVERGRIGALVFCGIPVIHSCVHPYSVIKSIRHFFYAVWCDRGQYFGRLPDAHPAKLACGILYLRCHRNNFGLIICKYERAPTWDSRIDLTIYTSSRHCCAQIVPVHIHLYPKKRNISCENKFDKHVAAMRSQWPRRGKPFWLARQYGHWLLPR